MIEYCEEDDLETMLRRRVLCFIFKKKIIILYKVWFLIIYSNTSILFLITKFVSPLLKNFLPEAEAWVYLAHICDGYRALYREGYAHRDLKAKNIFFRRNPVDASKLIAKVGDYGFIKRLDLQQKDPSHTLLGSTPYMSPELLTQNSKYDFKADVWSLGMLFYQMLFGRLPFNIDSNSQHINAVLNCIKRNKLELETPSIKTSEKAQTLLRSLLNTNAAERMAWEDIFLLLLT